MNEALPLLSADDILNTPDTQACHVFGRNTRDIDRAYRRLVSRWHPDHNDDPRAGDVFIALQRLKTAARRGAKADPKTALGRWDWLSEDGNRKTYRSFASHETDTGRVIIGAHSIAYQFTAETDWLAAAERKRVAGLSFAGASMRREMARFLPRFSRAMSDEAGASVNVFSRDPDTVLLEDLVAHFKGSIPSVHVAWIVSGLLNIACYLDWAGLMHPAIGPDSILIEPAGHLVSLVGGWGLTVPVGDVPVAVPERAHSAGEGLDLAGGAKSALNLRLIRQAAQEIAGESDLPIPMKAFLLGRPRDSALDDYRAWGQVLERSFGKRRFVEMPVSAGDIYAG